jgi:protein TonB
VEAASSENVTRVAGLVGASILLHAGLIALLGRVHPIQIASNPAPLEVAVIEKPVPPPPPPPPAPVRMKAAPRQAPLDLPPATRVQPPTKAPPPPTQEAPEATQKPIVLPGITMESTTQGGSFAVPSGNTLRSEPARTAPDPAAPKPYKAERYVTASQVNELPAVESRPDSLRSFYPEPAKQRGVEGDVVLRLLIDADGSLAKVEVVSEPGEGLGAAGVRAIRQYRFKPGKVNGQPVATTITWVLHFILE